MSELWDAVVIGAGPAGSVIARELARRNLQTLLVEKALFPRPKVCGGCLNGNALSALRAAGLGHVPESLGAMPTDCFVVAAGGHRATVSLPRGVALSRSVFDDALAREAVRAGVTFRTGVKATVGPYSSGTTQVRLESDRAVSTVSTRVVIVAGGLNGQSTAGLGAETNGPAQSRIGAGVILADAPPDYLAGRIHMAVADGGYVGLVRVDGEQLEIAAAFDASFVRLQGGLGRAAASVISSAGLPEIPGLEIAAWKGTPALTRRPQRVAGPGWFAVGDAAGYVEPFTGEGMAWAIGGALALAPIAIRSLALGCDAGIREWTRTHARLIGRRQWSCRLLARLLRSLRASRWLIAALSVAPGLAGPVVRGLNRPPRLSRSMP